MGLDETACRDGYYAGLLHEVGAVGPPGRRAAEPAADRGTVPALPDLCRAGLCHHFGGFRWSTGVAETVRFHREVVRRHRLLHRPAGRGDPPAGPHPCRGGLHRPPPPLGRDGRRDRRGPHRPRRDGVRPGVCRSNGRRCRDENANPLFRRRTRRRGGACVVQILCRDRGERFTPGSAALCGTAAYRADSTGRGWPEAADGCPAPESCRGRGR